MANILSISIDGTNVTEGLLKHTRLIKIIQQNHLLADDLVLIINKDYYQSILPKQTFSMEIASQKHNKDDHQIKFNIYTEYNFSNSLNLLTEAEVAIAKDPNNVVVCGLSTPPDFITNYEKAVAKIASTAPYGFKNTTLLKILEELRKLLKLDEVIADYSPKILGIRIPYFAVNTMLLQQDVTYSRTRIHVLANIFDAYANIRNNKLYFMQKRYGSFEKSFQGIFLVSNKGVIDIKNVPGMYHKEPKCKGVIYDCFTINENTKINKIDKSYKQESLGRPPFLKLNEVYEASLANIYAKSKLKELEEPETLKLTVKGIHNKVPGYYLIIKKTKTTEALKESIAKILGGYSVKSCIMTYNPPEHTHQDPNEAGPSAKKAKLDYYWSTALDLVRIKEPNANKK